MVTFCCWCSQNLFHFSGLLLDDPPVFPFLTRTFYGYIWSGLLWSTTWLHLLQSLDSWREEKSWEEDRRRIKECSQAKTDRELLREVKINVLDIECRTCFFSLQDSGESCWPEGIMGGRGEPPLKTSQYFIRLGKTSTLIFLYNISPKSEHFKSWFLPWCKHAADASNTADALMLLMCQCYSYADAVCPILEKGSFFMKIWAKYEHFINKKYEQNTTKKHAKYGENMSKLKFLF